ncbi:hypothetical protein AK812_SmicGene30392 [Symbiodinium microadriaticum]|uniref:Uncharacterized protein n=1 Tax=Symbiodinium microadriaticum TaxID=2951 RepID=A0A1Q9CZF0_SYMMI|nr:hypothetical protein AK812_SmicGene30392 [Symbiodinium microadriaticum]CAE7882513.1 unnamed protein product [Symbiodinium microadriaticum]
MAWSNVDLDLWKVMINGNSFRKMVDSTASAVLVVGPMGAGKSTTIAIQTGAKYEAVKEEVEQRAWVKMEQQTTEGHQTADGYTSKTLNMGLYIAEERFGGYTYLDTAGLNEDRTGTHRAWTQWSLATSFSLLPKITSVILVMDFRTLVAERGHGVRAMARSLLPITGSGQASKHFYDSMIFLFTNAYEDGERVEAESIIQIAKTQFSEQKQLFKIFCQRRTDVDAQAIVDDPDFAEHTALLTFLETLSEATGRVHVCFPDTPEKSDRQRVAVQKMIEGSKPITRRVLGEIVSTRPTGNLEVLQIFAKLATEPDSRLDGKSYTEILHQKADHLQRLVHLKEKHKERLQAMTGSRFNATCSLRFVRRRYEIKGGDYKGEIRIEEPAKGVLNVDFTSTPGVNLDVTVSFYRPEKDTEETAQQVASLERQVDSLAAQLEECETKICSFTCADSPTNLAALIMTEKDALEQADRDLVEMLDRPATQPTDDFPKPPSQWSVITNFRGFVQAWDQVQKHLRELERGPGSSIITLRKSDLSSHQSEDAPPVKPSFRAMARASMETFCTASVVDKAFLFYEGLKRQPVALAVALCTYGILLKVWPSDSLQGVFGNMLLALSVYVLAWQICNVGVHKAALTADSVGHQVGSFKPWLEGLARDAGAATGDMTQSLGDRLAAALDKAVGNLKALVTVF